MLKEEERNWRTHSSTQCMKWKSSSTQVSSEPLATRFSQSWRWCLASAHFGVFSQARGLGKAPEKLTFSDDGLGVFGVLSLLFSLGLGLDLVGVDGGEDVFECRREHCAGSRVARIV